jgi:hypothetical protein
MEPDVRQRFDEIWAVLREVAERQKAAEERAEKTEQGWDRRMQKAEERTQKSDQKWERRMQKVEERMERSDQKWDKRFEATRKLVESGIGIVLRLGKRQSDLERAHKAFVDSFRKGNTNGRKRG